MKRKLLLVTLSILVILSLTLTGCNFSKKSTDGDTAAPMTAEQIQAAITQHSGVMANYALQSQLNAYAAVSDVYTKDEVDDKIGSVDTPDLANYATFEDISLILEDFIDNLTPDQIDVLKTKLGITGGGGGDGDGDGDTPPVTGEVTVVIDTEYLTFVTNATASNQMYPVKIVNGTGDYQQVKFGLILQCITTSPDNTAESTAITTAQVNTGNPFSVNGVPGSIYDTGICDPDPGDCGCTTCPCANFCLGDCQLVYFTWTATDSILVPPNHESIVYVHINGITTDNAEVWQISLTGVITTKL